MTQWRSSNEYFSFTCFLLVSTSVMAGETATFICQINYYIDCPSQDRVYWVHRPIGGKDSDTQSLTGCSQVLSEANVDKYSAFVETSGNDTTYTLVINNVSPADSKEYNCFAFRGVEHESSSRGVLIVTNRAICPTPLNMSVNIIQKEDLVVGGVGEFYCDTNPQSGSSSFRWLKKDSGNQTVSINTTGRFVTSANRLIVSQLLASDNGSQVRCEMTHTTDCELPSPWYHLFLIPGTFDPTEQEPKDFSTVGATSKQVPSKGHDPHTLAGPSETHHPSEKPSETGEPTPAHRPGQTQPSRQSSPVGVIVIGIVATLFLITFTITFTCHMVKSRRSPIDREPAYEGATRTVASSLQMIEKELF
ncbi:uncharacterized protein LOC110976064 isoform X2 [Acanthaster planci]|uniref:Uncharacterized protein LOC110976064 isoform X2 n=1 Tax=Acanthaster planci TaxID=133434 RepID=A0A8B7XV40_ACAPL|nr:uncharacterized protein LOC110976064 isoform X2 [Acanthaster planci]